MLKNNKRMYNNYNNYNNYKYRIEKSLLVILLDLFVAGGETASSNLTWGILFLSMYPEVQQKIHIELDQVIGKGRLPSVSDRLR